MKLRLLALIVGLQIAWVLGMVVVQETALARGRLILLETQPVDPRDLLRGDYVILSYKISDLPLSSFPPPAKANPSDGTTIYVVLEQRGQFHDAVQASTDWPLARPDQVVLKGRRGPSWGSDVRVEYGLERYHVPEGTGDPRGKLTVQVSVDRSGRGVIKQVFVNGKPYAEAMREQMRHER